MMHPTFTAQLRPIAIVILAFAATAALPARQNASTTATAAKVTEELVHVQTSDGITNGGAVFEAAAGSASPIAVIWVHGSQLNFYDPAYVTIGREHLASSMRDCALITAPYRMGSNESIGTLGVVGPMRIEYARIMAMVNYLARLIEERLGEQTAR